MNLPGRYKAVLLFWLVAVVPFWWFATAFNDLPFFALPVWASPAEGPGWQSGLIVQIAVCAAMAAPLVLLPVALIVRGRNFTKMSDNAQD